MPQKLRVVCRLQTRRRREAKGDTGPLLLLPGREEGKEKLMGVGEEESFLKHRNSNSTLIH